MCNQEMMMLFIRDRVVRAAARLSIITLKVHLPRRTSSGPRKANRAMIFNEE